MNKILSFLLSSACFLAGFSSPIRDDLAAKGIEYIGQEQVIPVAYLEATGGQYIDTLFKANTGTTEFDISIIFSNTSVAQGLFGSRNQQIANNQAFNAFILATGRIRADFTGDGVQVFSPVVGERCEIEYYDRKVYINGNFVRTPVATNSDDQYFDFLLFNFSNGSNYPFSTGLIGCIEFAKIYDNGVLVRDLQPVRIGNEGFLYDQVSGLLFGNSGTGSFILGPDL